jgi:hypothetical protein
MAIISDIVSLIRNRGVPKFDPTLMDWPRTNGAGSVRIQRTLWLLVDADAVGLDALDGAAFLSGIIARAERELVGADAALPSAREPDGPGGWRGVLAKAVRGTKRPASVLRVSLAGEPEWRRWILEAVIAELELTDAVVIRAAIDR